MIRALRRQSTARYAAAAAAYTASFGVAFHGVALHPGSRLPYGLNDGTSQLRFYWAAERQHRSPFTLTRDALAAAPQGAPTLPALELSDGALQTAFVWELRGTFGLIGAWNAFLFLGFLATGLAMLVFLLRIGCSYGASLFGGFVFAFGPYALERAYAGHAALLHNWIYPLLAGLLLRSRRGASYMWSAAAGGVLGIAFYLSAYQWLLASFLVLVFWAVEFVRRYGRRARLGAITHAAIAWGVSLVAISPVIVLYARERTGVNATVEHPRGDFVQFGAPITAYLLPSPRNPLFHWLRGVHPADLTEHTLFFGYGTAALAIVASVLLARDDYWLRESEDRRTIALTLTVLVPAAFLMSLPPHYHLGGISIPTPPALVEQFTSFWRVYARFGLLAGFGLVGLAALGLTRLAALPGLARLATPLAFAIVILELLPGNVHAFDAKTVPDWATWLAARPPATVVTYPWLTSGALASDLWYQTFDRDPEFASVTLTGRQEAIRLLARDLWRPITAEVLATEGVRYVVVHDDAYREEGGLPSISPKHYKLLKRFPDVSIYAVRASRIDLDTALRENAAVLSLLQEPPPPTLAYGAGFNDEEQFNNQPSRWMIQNGQLELDSEHSTQLVLRGIAFSNGMSRTLELRDASGHLIGRRTIPTFAVHFRFGPFRIPAGNSTLTLTASPRPVVLGGSDDRRASVFLEPIQAVPLLTYAPSP